MSQDSKDHQKLIQALSDAIGIVSYEAIGDEPSIDDFIEKTGVRLPVYRTAPNASIPPEEALKSATALIGSGQGVVFLPGRKFDMTGTRHGRGGGWYDRFLKMSPPTWLKVGSARESQISKEPLLRKPWDQPVDFLIVLKENGWDVHDLRR